jgi:hypothetical protein
MPDPKNDPAPSQTPATQPPANVDPPLSFRTPLFGGTLTGSGSQPSPGLYQGNADYLFRNGDQLGAQLRMRTDPVFAIDQYGLNGRFGLGDGGTLRLDASGVPQTDTYRIGSQWQFANGNLFNADWNRTPTGQNYGADGAFKLGKDGNGTAAFRVDEAAGTSQANTQLKFDANTHLNADWLRNRDGQQIYGADTGFKLGKDGTGTAAFRVDEAAGTSQANTQLKFDANTHLNADWLRNRDGQQIYGADTGFKLGKDGNGMAAFRVDEAAGTSQANTQLKFDANTHLNADWLRNRDGQQIYGADTGFKLGKDGNGTAAFRVDEPAGTSMFNTKLKWNDGFGLGADYTNTKNGAIYGGETTFRLGQNGTGSGAFRIDEPAHTTSLNSKLRFDNGDTLNFDLAKSPAGKVYGADAAFGVWRDGKGLASFRIDEPNGASNYKLGASFPNGNELNATLTKDRLGNTFGVGGKLGFSDGAGSVGFDGKFGPVTSVGGSINFKNKDLEYSGVARLDNSTGPFRVSEFGAKIATTGSDRYQFTAEAGYRPETHETYGRVGITIHFGGGGSKPSRPISHAPDPVPFQQPMRPMTAARDTQPVVLPENRGLYEQAVSGVQRLNGSGAQLPVEQTAASLVVLAKENGIRNIDYVVMGHQTAGGKQNIFIGDGDPTGATSKQAHIDRAQAENTPLRDSLQKMDRTPFAQAPGQQMPAPGQEPVAAARR